MDENEVERPLTDDLVGDPDIAASRVGDLADGSRDDSGFWRRRAARTSVLVGSSRDVSCCSISRSSSRSEADGSIPSSSASVRRNVW
jgi:hypothetical protein